MIFDTTYLNRTPNKHPRSAGTPYVGAILHETAGYGSLEWCMRPEVRASFDILITRNGVPHRYLDDRYTALPIQAYYWAENAKPEFQTLAWGAIAVLIVFVLVGNLAAILLRDRFQKRYRW